MKLEVKYYINEQAKKSGVAAYKETIQGDKNFVTNWAENKLRYSNFTCYDITQL